MTEERERILCVAETQDEGWEWFAQDFPEYEWRFIRLYSKTFLEKMIQVPNLARLKGALKAARLAKDASLIFTHHPHVTFWCANLMSRARRPPHVAWSFNFPELPRGPKRTAMSRAFQKVDRFVVYSTMERDLYVRELGIPRDKIEVILWGVSPPEPSPGHPIVRGDYVCAIGGNRRDYETLIHAAEMTPGIKFELVVRPRNLKGLALPPNVDVRVNLSHREAMNILKFSKFMVLPLDDSDVPTGHVTLVAAQHLGKAFVITDSAGVRDYILPGTNALTCPPSDPKALAERIEVLWQDEELREKLGRGGKEFASKYLSEEHVKDCLRSLMEDLLRKR